ncbi:lipid droplet-associated hydrolase-like [Peromyscus californicus insignis]|uniref:lipid droplet-associated hydrolase-like n=1 Tax=Peromyscus californicus insignis TaxID=564181 RepID=UPI0022A7FF9D|nr:lipid droplet-associated hydrolase-like [Peromyscus californicus insignis]
MRTTELNYRGLSEPIAQEIEDIYGLNGQIEHKIAFLRAHVPKDVKIILIGHSIGSCISLRVMKHAPELSECISSITEPNKLRYSASCEAVQTPCDDLRYTVPSRPRQVSRAKSQLLAYSEDLCVHIPALLWNVTIAECSMAKLATAETNAAYLGSQEMIHVRKRDDEIIKEHLPKLTFYYGKTDGWCPVKYYEDMKKDFPEGDIRLCEKGISHAFVLGFSQEVAAIVADWMNHKLPKI